MFSLYFLFVVVVVVATVVVAAAVAVVVVVLQKLLKINRKNCQMREKKNLNAVQLKCQLQF